METILVSREREAIVATDDRDASAIAQSEDVRVTAPLILRAIARDGGISAEEGTRRPS